MSSFAYAGFQLGGLKRDFTPVHYRFSSSAGAAFFGHYGGSHAAVNGFIGGGFPYVSRLVFGQTRPTRIRFTVRGLHWRLLLPWLLARLWRRPLAECRSRLCWIPLRRWLRYPIWMGPSHMDGAGAGTVSRLLTTHGAMSALQSRRVRCRNQLRLGCWP